MSFTTVLRTSPALRTTLKYTASRQFSTTLRTTMPAANESLKNASGLTPTESRALPTRQPNEDEKKILAAINNLYSSKPSNSDYDVYAPQATFHDPVGLAEGLDLVKAQFNALGKLFEKSTVDRQNVLETPAALPNTTILVDQDVSYYRKASGEPTKTINSLLTLERDATGKIVKHTEEASSRFTESRHRLLRDWDHKRETDKSDGFLGYINETRKSLSAKLTGAFVSSDANKI